MCRILGHFAADTPPHEVRAAALGQRHGGPDSQHLTYGPGWALACNRLAILDLDGGGQPFRLGEGIRLVFNGEIYNHQALRASLLARGHRISGRCDGNILPAMYAEYGPDFVDRLEGMFALALVDLRAEPLLLLATDHAGMKPLYYHWSRGRLHFSSELPGLLSFRDVPVRPWAPGLEAYLSTRTPLGEQTMFEEIRALPPAATLTVTRRAGLRLRLRDGAPAARPPGTLPEAARDVGDLLRREVARLAGADVPVCATVSGGLDSGLVAGFLSRSIPDLDVFHVTYRGDWPLDESRYAREVARSAQARYHQVEVDPDALPDLLSEVVWHLGQPNADPITVSTYALFQQLTRSGFKVALTGDGADEVFGGYDRMRGALSGGTGWRRDYARALAAVPDHLRAGLYTREYRDYLGSSSADPAIPDVTGRQERMRAIGEMELRHRLPAYHLRRVDHLSMAHGVEARLPFCQPAVMAAGRSLPLTYRITRRRGKRVLYAAARGLLPESVLTRPKQPFTLPIAAMMTGDRPLLSMAADLLTPARLRAGGQLDAGAVGRLLRTQRERPADDTALALWSLAVHQLWLERFFSGRAARSEVA